MSEEEITKQQQPSSINENFKFAAHAAGDDIAIGNDKFRHSLEIDDAYRQHRISVAIVSTNRRTLILFFVLVVGGLAYLFWPFIFGPVLSRCARSGRQEDALSNLGLSVFATTSLISISTYMLINYLQFGTPIVSKQRIRQIISGSSDGDRSFKIPLVMPDSTSQEGLAARDTPSFTSESSLSIRVTNRQLSLITERLNREITDLGRRGNVNLAIGILTTLMVVCVLGFVVFAETDPDSSDHWRFKSHFIVRISIALFIEVFAYFFLRLYKNNIDDIKYYQNEITNVELKWLALQTAEQLKKQTLLKIVIDSLIKTERNFVLKKGDSTLGLERERLEKNEILDLVKESIGSVSRSFGKK